MNATEKELFKEDILDFSSKDKVDLFEITFGNISVWTLVIEVDGRY